MLNGIPTKGFSAATIPPFPKLEASHKDEVVEFSRERYGTPREEVEKMIMEWAAPVAGPAQDAGNRNESYGTQRRFEGPRYDRPPRRDDRPPRREDRPRRPYQPPAGAQPAASLSALSQGAVDFKGRPVEKKAADSPLRRDASEPRQRREVDTSELKKILEEALKK